MSLRAKRSNLNQDKVFFVYILTNFTNSVLYIGITSDLNGRVWQHKNKVVEGFTKKYNVNKLVNYQSCDSPEGAIQREKQIKAGSRKKKIELINSINPGWLDLFQQI